MQTNSFKDLIVWQKSLDLVEEIYLITAKFPKEEIYGLTSQMRRASVSIPSNIAEGQRRKNIKEFLQFLRIAYGSASELETQILICKRLPNLQSLDYNKSNNLLTEIHKMLIVMLKTLEKQTINCKLLTIN